MKTLFFAFALLFLTLTISAQQKQANPELIKNFQDMKFGMFIHWGPVTLRGAEIGWSRGHQVAADDYDNLYKEFNPVLFDADKWIKTLKDAGMKYLVFTTRHHDGFSMWDTKFSDYNIMNSPYKKDVLMELKNACDKYGILFGTYYSICDWSHPNYPLSNIKGVDKPDADMDKFYTFLKNQTKELIEKYDTKILWFDGEWEEPWTHEYGKNFYNYLKGLNPDVLINNRVDKGRKGMEGVTISNEFAGDFATPEQRVGAFDIENPWESCITICKQWAWKPNDKMKSLDQCIQTLLKTVGGGGNLLFNVGPMMDGRMEQRQIDRLKEMGNWLKKYGKSVYGTTGGPYKPTNWISSTRKGDKIYLHLFSLENDELKIPLPGSAVVKNCSILKGEKLKFEQTKKELIIQVPQNLRDKIATTIVLDLNSDSGKIKPIEI